MSSEASKENLAARVIRLKKFMIAPEFFTMISTQGCIVPSMKVVEGVPEGAKLVNYGFDKDRAAFYFIVEHPSFDPLGVTDRMPLIQIKIERMGEAEKSNDNAPLEPPC